VKSPLPERDEVITETARERVFSCLDNWNRFGGKDEVVRLKASIKEKCQLKRQLWFSNMLLSFDLTMVSQLFSDLFYLSSQQSITHLER